MEIHTNKHPSGQLVSRVRSRLAFPLLAVAMGVSTLIAGLDHSQYLVAASGHAAALTPDSAYINSGSTAAVATGPESHARVDAWVQRLTTSLRGDFTQSLARMDKYEDMITKKLDAKQMPHELIYLAMIESNFNPTAKSKVGAVGMWQFMKTTAKQFGLTVKGKTDERKNPEQATDAALTYLSALHDRFGSWNLAAAAYNSGAGTVSKALRNVLGQTKGSDEDFFRILSALPKETQDYVPKLLASAMVGSDPAKYGMPAE